MALQGTVDDVAVVDVLRMLAKATKTGHLRLESEMARGVVWLRDGQVTAVTETAPRLGTSVVELVFWVTVASGGWFHFEIVDGVPDAEEPAEVDRVLSEVAVLVREWDELHRVVPSLVHRVGLVEQLPEATVTIDADVWPAVRAAAAQPQVQDLGARFGLGDLDTLRAVRDLVGTGMVEIHPPSADAADAAADPGAADPAGPIDQPPRPTPQLVS